MMSIPRKIRRLINDRVLDIEELDLKKETLESFKQKLGKTCQYLEGNGVTSESEYRKRLRVIEEKADSFFKKIMGSNNNHHAPISNPIRLDIPLTPKPELLRTVVTPITYVGIIKGPVVRVIADKDHYYLQSNYGPNKLKLRWSFNECGRLEQLEFGTNETFSLIVSIQDIKDRPIRWNYSPIKVYPFSDEVASINTKLYGRDAIAYELLMGWGHITSRKILELSEGTGIGRCKIQNGERNLSTIVQNDKAIEMIGEARKIFPFLEFNGDSYTLTYRQNRK